MVKSRKIWQKTCQ